MPAAPLLLPAATPTLPPSRAAPVEALRADARSALSGLADADVVVVLAAGSEPLVHDAVVATLTSYGIAGADVAIDTDAQVIAAITARGQASLVRSDRLDGDLAVLASQAVAARPGVPVVPVTVPGLAHATSLRDLAAGLAGAAAAVTYRVAVVVAGDLAATLDASSPGYLVDGASDWDAAACAAVRERDLDAIGVLGPDDAVRVQARGWASLTVLVAIAAAAGCRIASVSYHAPRGVGAVVVTAGTS